MGIRKNQATLSVAERTAFVQAVKALKANGTYDVFVDQHRTAFMSSPNDPAHGGPAFGPWHREFLVRFERALQAIDPGVTLPYWDWTVDNSTTSSLWHPEFMGGDGASADEKVTTGPFAHATGQWTLTVLDPGETDVFLKRNLGGMGRLPTKPDVDSALNVTPYDASPWDFNSDRNRSFRQRLEVVIHNSGHMWVGGSMMAMSSPNDPVFFLHHCNIDRLWAEWQLKHPNEPYVPASGTPNVVAGHGLDDPMPPWTGQANPPTPRSVLDWHALGYQYDTEPTLPKGPLAQGDDMQPGEVLEPGTSISSANGQYTFIYQGDGNLVLYRNRDGKALWASGTHGTSTGVCIMQGDGNLVVYDAAVQPVWDSGTWQDAGSHLVVQDDGNVVIYRTDGSPAWATNTVQPVLPTGPAAQGDDMQPGEVLLPDQPITSANGQYNFVYQSDGNLVLYRNRDGAPLWASGTNGTSIGVCIMQGDGNLVVYDTDVSPVWSSGTWQDPGAHLVVQDDGNVVIYRTNGTPAWATNTVQPVLPGGPIAQGDDAQPGETLAPDQPIASANGQYNFVYQSDGNLVLYRNRDSKALWASGTHGTSVGVCIMQGDGNLVIYDTNVQPVWSSGTWQDPGSRLVVQDDGNVVIYRPDNSPAWATNTVQPVIPTGGAATGDDMLPGEVLGGDQSITSGNGLYTFVYQGDGNLVLYRNIDGTPLWAAGTHGTSVGVCVMQGDGNLVVYDGDVRPVWSSGTWQHGGSRVIVQDDGNVVVYRPDNLPVWASNTVQP